MTKQEFIDICKLAGEQVLLEFEILDLLKLHDMDLHNRAQAYFGLEDKDV